MKPKLLLIIVIIFLSSCSSLRHDLDSIEFMSYNYFWKNKTEIKELRCYRYSIIDRDGDVLYYQWKRHPTDETLYCKSIVEKGLLDSILIEAEKQKVRNSDIQGLISMYGGPLMKIKISHCNGTFEVIDFKLDDNLSKYFMSIDNEEILKPINDTIDLNKKKLELINLIWKEDSTLNKIIPPPHKL